MMTGWEFLLSAAVAPADIELVCVRINGDFGQVPVAESEFWLSCMRFFTSYEDEGWLGHPKLAAEDRYEFQVWTRDRIYRTRPQEGIITLEIWPRTAEHWMRVASRTQRGLIEIGTSRIWYHGEASSARDDGDLSQFDDLMTVGSMLAAWSRGQLTDDQVSRLMELDDDDDLYKIARNNHVAPPQHRDIKAQLARGIAHATENAGLADQRAFLRATGMQENRLGRAIDEPDSVPLDEFVRVFDEASAQAGWHSAGEIIREVVDRQRFGEWP